MIGFLISLAIGGCSGYIASRLLSTNWDIVKSVVLGFCGGFVAKLLFSLIGISFHGIIGDFIAGVLGAIIVVYIARTIKL